MVHTETRVRGEEGRKKRKEKKILCEIFPLLVVVGSALPSPAKFAGAIAIVPFF